MPSASSHALPQNCFVSLMLTTGHRDNQSPQRITDASLHPSYAFYHLVNLFICCCCCCFFFKKYSLNSLLSLDVITFPLNLDICSFCPSEDLVPLWNHFSWPRARCLSIKIEKTGSKLGIGRELALEPAWLQRGIGETGLPCQITKNKRYVLLGTGKALEMAIYPSL